MKVTREVFDAQRRPRFGTANPERMRVAFWEWMARGDPSLVPERFRERVRTHGFGPWHARSKFGVDDSDDGGPIWGFIRTGATTTELPDGRIVCIGGEIGDDYEPDFYAYNDVVVLGPDGTVEIYGYPRDAFLPTDFHSATLVGERIFVVGRLGYPCDHVAGTTPVYTLDLNTFRIDAVATSGEPPDFIREHDARYDAARDTLVVTGGKVCLHRDHAIRRLVPTCDDYELRLADGVWRRATDRRWTVYYLNRPGRAMFALAELPRPESLFPRRLRYERLSGGDRNARRIAVFGVPVAYTTGVSRVVITVEGVLPDVVAEVLLDDARTSVEEQFDVRCLVDGP